MSYEYYYTEDIEKEMKNLQNRNKRPTNYGLAVASLIIGIVSMVFFLFVINVFSAIAAIIMGFIFLAGTRRGEKGRRMAVAGIITSFLSIALCIGSYVLIAQNADSITTMMENEMKNNLRDEFKNDPRLSPYENDGPAMPFDGFDDFDDLYEFYGDDFGGHEDYNPYGMGPNDDLPYDSFDDYKDDIDDTL